ncbi:gamma-glutamyltransferase [Rhodospirillaceae bacterium SYSU D60014]|uniref:gamma-glutamyltransferase n=1 Tax=Virgifigura deserti TaxID=2268457 RepID=UPI000E6606F8
MRDFQAPGRSPVHATNGMVATSHPLATGAALDILKSGGNAIDAAITAAAVLAVVEPQSTGIGGDCFALYCPKGGDQVIALNGSGRSPKAATLEWFQEQGIREITTDSVHSATLPGAIDGWTVLNRDYGTKDLAELLAPAIRYAEEGYPIHARVRFDWLSSVELLSKDTNAKALFLPNGAVPAEGDIHRQPQLAATLRAIGKDGRAAFYEGAIAEAMVAYLRGKGGLHTVEDFAATKSDYVRPIATRYRGFDVHQVPPNNQGLTALIMLNILEGFDLAGLDPMGADRLHLEVEAGRLAYWDRDALFADESAMTVTVADLLSKGHAASRRGLIRHDAAMTSLPDPGLAKSDTVYLCVVDRDLNAVSFINSIYHSFGSGLLCPQTGVMFQNRGASFRIDPSHPNRIEPAKRPLHTIMPGMVVKDGRAMMPYGVMGGDYQPFGHVHLLTGIVDYGLDVQAALDAPRAFYTDGAIEAERGIPGASIAGLLEKQHQVRITASPHGGGQAIRIDHDRGVLTGGSDPRKDGCALGY